MKVSGWCKHRIQVQIVEFPADISRALRKPGSDSSNVAVKGHVVFRVNVKQMSVEGQVSGALVESAATALDRMKPGPASPLISQAAGSIDEPATVVSQPMSDLWEPLLDSLSKFSKVADHIAEVISLSIASVDRFAVSVTYQVIQIHPYAQVAWGILSATYKVPSFLLQPILVIG